MADFHARLEDGPIEGLSGCPAEPCLPDLILCTRPFQDATCSGARTEMLRESFCWISSTIPTLIHREDAYHLSPARVRTASINSFKKIFIPLEILDFIPGTLQEVEPAVEQQASLAAREHRCLQHHRQIPYQECSFTPRTYVCLLQK